VTEKHIAFYSSLEGLGLSISRPRLIFSEILLPQQHDSLAMLLPVLLQGVVMAQLPGSSLVLAELHGDHFSPPACHGVSEWQPCSQHINRMPTSTPPYNSLLSSFSGSFMVSRRTHTHMHTHKLRMIV